jgi:winged helix-turn helix protein
MSSKELRRAGILARVKSGELKLVNAAVMMGLSYRQSKRLAKRYREEGAKGLKHGSAGRESNRRKPKKFRERVLRLVGKKYSGEEGERFGPTLAAEHLGHLSRMLCLRDSCRSFEARLKHGIELVKSGSDVSGQGSPLTLLEGRDGEAEFEF